MSEYRVIFRSRLNPQYEEEYLNVAEKMDTLVKTIPGFIGQMSYKAADGERLTISEFDSEHALNQWKMHPEHLKAQALGKEKFYSEYSVEVTRLERSYKLSNPGVLST